MNWEYHVGMLEYTDQFKQRFWMSWQMFDDLVDDVGVYMQAMITSSDVRVTSSDVQSTSSDVQSTSSDVRVTSSDVQSTSSDVRVTYERQVAMYE